MKKLILLLALATSSLALAERESGGRLAARAVYVQFGSLGYGIDNNTKAILENYISLHEDQFDKFVLERQGREGEVLYCMKVKGPGQRVDLIKAVASSILKDYAEIGAHRTRVLLGMECKQLEMATEQDLTKYID